MVKSERLFVWVGGALFVASLAGLVCWYAVALGRPYPYAGARSIAADLALFSLFALHHSLLARAPVKAVLSRVIPDRLLRSVYVWTASLLLIMVCLLWQPIGGELYQTPNWLTVALIVARLAGVWLIVRSVAAIDALELAGIRHSGSGSEELQITGPYQLVRHPLYLGWMLIVFAPAEMTGDRLVFALISSFYLIVAIPWEERSLQRLFPGAYARYAQRVRWRVIPYVF
jgi:protein-S-isoprenylcysteine O-methyltransferase Ste14